VLQVIIKHLRGLVDSPLAYRLFGAMEKESNGYDEDNHYNAQNPKTQAKR
jgi:hypothetical protein